MLTELTSNHSDIRHWADVHQATPIEILPYRVDGINPTLGFALPGLHADPARTRSLSWSEFFERFDLYELYFAYEETSSTPLPHFQFLHDIAKAMDEKSVH